MTKFVEIRHFWDIWIYSVGIYILGSIQYFDYVFHGLSSKLDDSDT
jgi:hypothetical protein